MGCVRLTELFLAADPPTAVELSDAITVVHAHLDDLRRELPMVSDATRLITILSICDVTTARTPTHPSPATRRNGDASTSKRSGDESRASGIAARTATAIATS